MMQRNMAVRAACTSFASHFHPTSTTTKVKLIFSLLSRYVQLQIQRKVSKYYNINITNYAFTVRLPQRASTGQTHTNKREGGCTHGGNNNSNSSTGASNGE